MNSHINQITRLIGQVQPLWQPHPQEAATYVRLLATSGTAWATGHYNEERFSILFTYIFQVLRTVCNT